MEKVEEKLREMLLMQLEQVQENSLELNRLSLSQYEASLARCDAAVQQLEENNRKFNEVILTQMKEKRCP